jgi:membrane fusion protein (multidrug efflux system)
MPHSRLTVPAPVFLAAWLALAAHPAAAQQAPQATPVTTIAAATQPVTPSLGFVGRVEAIERVEVRARVTGYLEAVLFKEGDIVKEGDKLYQIEFEPFQAAVQQAQGELLQAQARYTNAALQAARAQELVKTSATSVAERDTRVADQQNAQGQVVIADANLTTAKINLGYTTIIAPITGKIGRTAVTKGNVVSPDSGPLTLIVSQDPIYVTFPVSERDFQRARQTKEQLHVENLQVIISFADGTQYDKPGIINFVGVTVDKTTDTMTVRATVPNPNGVLVDGQFVRLSVQGDKPTEQIVVPQAALLADQEGTYVFVVQDGKAQVKRIKIGAHVGRGVAVETGLNVGDQVVVGGLQSLRPGATVIASPYQGI